MSRRAAVLLGALVAVLAATELVVLSGLLAAERRADRERYAMAVSRQRRAAGRTLMPVGAPGPAAREPSRFCVRGVDTLAATVRAGLQKELIGAGQRLDVPAVREVSDLAVRAERYVELATAGPALPQRMGRTRQVSDDQQTSWVPLVPATVECEDGTGYASFRLDVASPPVPAATAAPAGKSGPKGKQTGRQKGKQAGPRPRP